MIINVIDKKILIDVLNGILQGSSDSSAIMHEGERLLNKLSNLDFENCFDIKEFNIESFELEFNSVFRNHLRDYYDNLLELTNETQEEEDSYQDKEEAIGRTIESLYLASAWYLRNAIDELNDLETYENDLTESAKIFVTQEELRILKYIIEERKKRNEKQLSLINGTRFPNFYKNLRLEQATTNIKESVDILAYLDSLMKENKSITSICISDFENRYGPDLNEELLLYKLNLMNGPETEEALQTINAISELIQYVTIEYNAMSEVQYE